MKIFWILDFGFWGDIMPQQVDSGTDKGKEGNKKEIKTTDCTRSPLRGCVSQMIIPLAIPQEQMQRQILLEKKK